MDTAAAEFPYNVRRAAELPASYHRAGEKSEKNGAEDVVEFDPNGNAWSIFMCCDILHKFRIDPGCIGSG